MIMRKFVIVLGRHGTHRRQVLAGHKGEIVMFIVISHIESQPVERSVVTVGFLTTVHDVMFSDKVSCHGVDPHSKQGSNTEVGETSKAIKVENDQIKGQTANDIDDFKS